MSSQLQLNTYVDEVKNALSARRLETLAEREINYGKQLQVSDGENTITLNIYYSQKKGVSSVIGGAETNPLRPVLTGIIGELDNNLNPANIHSWESWLGTDEAGKGDFFGALVVAGFFAGRDIVPDLQRIGVKDSKKLMPPQIEKLAHKLYKAFNDRICVIVLKPETYNKLYRDFRAKGKKLNELMAWMHGRIILDLQKRTGEKRVLVDKFTTDSKLIRSLQGLEKIELLQVPKAEQDLAVAAASIIARYHYLASLKQLKSKFRIDFRSGSGEQSLITGIEFVKKYSVKRLNEVAKIHFKNYDKIKTKLLYNEETL
jgi:ribonuclease HIII